MEVDNCLKEIDMYKLYFSMILIMYITMPFTNGMAALKESIK